MLEQVHKHPAHLVSSVNDVDREGSVQSNHPENSCDKTLHTLLSL